MSQPFALPAHNWRPRKDQVPTWNALIRPKLRKAVIVASRRWGKDETTLAALSVHAMRRTGSYIYCLPQYEQGRKILWEMINHRTGRTRINDFFPDEIVEKRDSQSMKLFLTSGSTIQIVGSDAPDSLVGGGYAGVIMSEAALSDPRAMQLMQPVLEESNGFAISISTPRGKTGRGGAFYRAYLAAKEDMAKGDETVYAAYLPADKTGLFPPEQLFRIKMDLIREHGQAIGEAMFNQEYLCSWDSVAIGGVWAHELTELEMEGRFRPCPHDRRYTCTTSWDLGLRDYTSILVFQHINGEHRLIDAVEANNIGLDTYIAQLKQMRVEKGYNFAQHFAPHDISTRDFVRNVSRLDEAKRMGLEFTRTPQTRVKTQIAAAAQLIRQMVVNESNPAAVHAMERFKGWKFAVNKATGQVMDTPTHDDNSHAASALCTYAVQMAMRLGSAGGFKDPGLHADAVDLGGGGKFDPRTFGGGRVPYGHEGSVSNMMRGRQGGGTAFG